jgi:hypothetical protein
MEKLYNKVSQYTCLRAPTAQVDAQAERRKRENVSQKYNSSTNIFFRYREPAVRIKEKKDKGIGGIQFLPTDFQKDKRGKFRSIIFRKRKPAKFSGKHNGISDYPCP